MASDVSSDKHIIIRASNSRGVDVHYVQNIGEYFDWNDHIQILYVNNYNDLYHLLYAGVCYIYVSSEKAYYLCT